jgi:serine/threonine protein kinase
MGVVYRARDLALGRMVAIKTLPRVSPEEAAHLRREARAMAALSHPNLAVIFGAETWHGTPLLVVEYLGGGTFADRLQRRTSTQAEIIELGLTLTDALEYIHGVGILHSDIKPANIGFTTHNVPKLLDFGLAHIFRESHRRSASDVTAGVLSRFSEVEIDQWSVVSSRFAGTPLYMSPEAIDAQPPSPSFDVWSLAVVMYEALAGANPFAARTLAEVYERITKIGAPDLRTFRADLPACFAEFFAEALALDFKQRPVTASALRQRLSVLRTTALIS